MPGGMQSAALRARRAWPGATRFHNPRGRYIVAGQRLSATARSRRTARTAAGNNDASLDCAWHPRQWKVGRAQGRKAGPVPSRGRATWAYWAVVALQGNDRRAATRPVAPGHAWRNAGYLPRCALAGHGPALPDPVSAWRKQKRAPGGALLQPESERRLTPSFPLPAACGSAHRPQQSRSCSGSCARSRWWSGYAPACSRPSGSGRSPRRR